MIEVQKSKGKGRGVFALEDIPKNVLFHKAPVIIVNWKHNLGELENYVFYWDTKNVALALGYGSLFNHSESANAIWEIAEDRTFPEIHFTSKRKIKAGEEILISYGNLYEWEERPKG